MKKLRRALEVVVVAGSDEGSAARITSLLGRSGAKIAVLHSTAFVARPLGPRQRAAIARVETYDFVLFTSRQAVKFFARARMGRAWKAKTAKIVAIGPGTAAALREHGMRADLIPAKSSSEHLAELLRGRVAGRRILFPRSAIAPAESVRALRGYGASVTTIALYTTVVAKIPRGGALSAVEDGRANRLVFMSPSGIDGLLGNVRRKDKALGITALCIGPRTAAAARKRGFTTVITAPQSNMKGILALLRGVR